MSKEAKRLIINVDKLQSLVHQILLHISATQFCGENFSLHFSLICIYSFEVKFLKEQFDVLGLYTYLLSNSELDETIDTSLISVG